jgi:hypothetical protein
VKAFVPLPPEIVAMSTRRANDLECRAHRGDAKRFVARADEKLTAFIELESAVRNQQSVVFMRLFARRSLSNY